MDSTLKRASKLAVVLAFVYQAYFIFDKVVTGKYNELYQMELPLYEQSLARYEF